MLIIEQSVTNIIQHLKQSKISPEYAKASAKGAKEHLNLSAYCIFPFFPQKQEVSRIAKIYDLPTNVQTTAQDKNSEKGPEIQGQYKFIILTGDQETGS